MTMPLNALENRDDALQAFLSQNGYANRALEAVSGDASFRRYFRLKDTSKSLILMDAPPPEEDTRPFVDIAEHLLSIGLSAPQIIAKDITNGFLLLEDLGVERFKEYIAQNPESEEMLYKAALDTLISLKNSAAPDIASYDTATYQREYQLFIDWYIKLVGFDVDAGKYESIWSEIFAKHSLDTNILVLRDYHAENLLWLPTRDGVSNVGLLDFQDALIGDPAYDVVSLLEDARRDVYPDFAESMIEYYLSKTESNENKFKLHYSILGAQRNLKIIGIFARLAMRDKKTVYLKHLPRVFGYLEKDIEHPALLPLKEWLDASISKEVRKQVPDYHG